MATTAVAANERSLWYVAPERARIECRPPPTRDAENQVLVGALCSGVSRGTERLVFSGRVPESERQRMRAPFQEGTFAYPIKYGYASVGEVLEGPESLLGRVVFCLYPHQSVYVVPQDAVVPVPATVPPGRAILAANMETAVNAVWDAELGVGEHVNVIGAGVVGCLVAYLAARHPGTRVTLIDTDPRKQPIATRLGVAFSSPADAPREVDLVVHASGNPAGLALALELAAMEARIIELSWYGDGLVSLPLGGAFHAKRLTLRSSQVGALPPAKQPRWDHRRRLALALALLNDPTLDVLVTSECPLEDLPEALGALFGDQACELMRRVVY